MSIQITRRDVEDAFSHLRDMQSRLSRHSSSGEAIVGQVAQSVEVAAGALANGVLSGRFGNMYLGTTKVPVDLLVGLGAHGLAFFGLAGKQGEHLHNFADGFLAGYLTKLGAGLGSKWAAQSGAAPHAFAGSGARARMGAGAPARQPLSESELASLAQAIR